eukprot:1183552-Prorocentrum_minimum.AAC.2
MFCSFFDRSSCASNGEGARNTPETRPESVPWMIYDRTGIAGTIARKRVSTYKREWKPSRGLQLR